MSADDGLGIEKVESRVQVKGLMETDKSSGSSLAKKAIICSDETDKVGVPKAIQWAIGIEEGESLSSLGCLFGIPVHTLTKNVWDCCKEGQECRCRNILWKELRFVKVWFLQVGMRIILLWN